MTCCCRYTEADNSVVVATDSIKNTIYIKAKEHPVNPPELYASYLGQHFLDKYAHISAANINVTVHRWTRMNIDGKAHPHSFFRDGEETRNVEARVTREGIDLKSGIAGLTVLKSTGSAFHGFVRDEYTTLGETWDRILSTDVDCTWSWKRFSSVAAVEEGIERFNRAWETTRNITMKIFAEDESASVQATMYKMCEAILAAEPEVELTGYNLPYKHYFVLVWAVVTYQLQSSACWEDYSPSTRPQADLSWHKGLKNTGKDAEVYAPQSGPNGLIKCEVRRS